MKLCNLTLWFVIVVGGCQLTTIGSDDSLANSDDVKTFSESSEDNFFCPAGSVDFFDRENNQVQGLLQNEALSHIEGFTYIKNVLIDWKSQSYTVCASGLVVGKNVHTYNQYLVQIKSYDRNGVETNFLPLLFQNETLQDFHNDKTKPWLVLNPEGVRSIYSQLNNTDEEPYSVELEAFDIKKIREHLISNMKSNEDKDTLLVMPMDTAEEKEPYYLASWAEKISGGNYFTVHVASVKQSSESRSTHIKTIRNAYHELSAPLQVLHQESKELENDHSSAIEQEYHNSGEEYDHKDRERTRTEFIIKMLNGGK